MSSLIKLCLKLGATVSGSDSVQSDILSVLSNLGARLYTGSNPEVVKQADLVVYTAAIPENDLELLTAKNLSIPTLSRAEFLGELSTLFKKVIAVGGTHGKTTVSALISTVLKDAYRPFTAHIGGNVSQLGGNMFFNGFDYFVTEACEYKQRLLEIPSDYAVLLNAESDPPDCYKTLSELYDTFNRFLANTIEKSGWIIINGDCNYYQMQKPDYKNTLTFGMADTYICYPVNVTEKNGLYSFDIMLNGLEYGHMDSPLYGHHNIYNILCAVLICNHIGIRRDIILNTLSSFEGVERRFQRLGNIGSNELIMDYACYGVAHPLFQTTIQQK